MYYEYQSPFPPFPILLLEAAALGMVLILAILLVEPLLQKLFQWWSETVDRWWVKRQAEREGR